MRLSRFSVVMAVGLAIPSLALSDSTEPAHPLQGTYVQTGIDHCNNGNVLQYMGTMTFDAATGRMRSDTWGADWNRLSREKGGGEKFSAGPHHLDMGAAHYQMVYGTLINGVATYATALGTYAGMGVECNSQFTLVLNQSKP